MLNRYKLSATCTKYIVIGASVREFECISSSVKLVSFKTFYDPRCWDCFKIALLTFLRLSIFSIVLVGMNCDGSKDPAAAMVSPASSFSFTSSASITVKPRLLAFFSLGMESRPCMVAYH